MDLRQLKYFALVADLGSFSRAAAALAIAQSALSRQVRLLEVEVKHTLFYRTGRGVQLTSAGECLHSHARAILAQVDNARDDLSQLRGEQVGHVNVGATRPIANVISVPFLNAFRTSLPRATCSISESLWVDVVNAMESGRIDFAVIHNPPPSMNIESFLVGEQAMYLVFPNDNERLLQQSEIRLRDLARLPLIMPSRPNALRACVDGMLSNMGLEPSIAVEVSGIQALLDMVKEGFGYGVMPINSIRAYRYADSMRARPIVEPELTISVFVVASTLGSRNMLKRSVLTLLQTVVRDVVCGPDRVPAEVFFH